MRIYKPQNELGQALLNDGQVVSVAKSLTKELTNGTIILSSSDISDIDSWEVSSVRVSIGGSEFSFTPEVSKGTGSISIIFSKDRFSELEFDKASIVLQRTDSRGIIEEEVSIEVLIASGDITKIDAYVDKVIAAGDKYEIQEVGAKLAESGIRKYILAGATSYSNAQKIMRAATPPISNQVGMANVFVEGGEFSYNLMSLKVGGSQSNNGFGLFSSPVPTNVDFNLYQFSSPLPNLEYGNCMFWGCKSLTTFTSFIPSLLIGSYMFNGCYNLTTFTSERPSLTNGYKMFSGCKLDLPSVQNIAHTINTYNSELTLGIDCTESVFNDHSTGWYDAVEAIKSKGWTVAVEYNG